MDPNATLEVIRDLCELDYSDQNAIDLVERVRALDEWIVRGGFLPHAWR